MYITYTYDKNHYVKHNKNFECNKKHILTYIKYIYVGKHADLENRKNRLFKNQTK